MERRVSLVLVLLAACVGDAEDDRSRRSYAEKAWLAEALPIFQANCMVCHWATGEPPLFLAGETPWQVRNSALASMVVNLASPESSRVLTKGAHAGPALLPREAAKILYWLQAESADRR